MIRPPEGLTLETIYITMIVLSCLVGIETAIILGLRLEVGSFRRLILMALGRATTSHKKTTKKKDVASNDI